MMVIIRLLVLAILRVWELLRRLLRWDTRDHVRVHCLPAETRLRVQCLFTSFGARQNEVSRHCTRRPGFHWPLCLLQKNQQPLQQNGQEPLSPMKLPGKEVVSSKVSSGEAVVAIFKQLQVLLSRKS